MILNIERENGLYLTTEKAVRKAFNKSNGTGFIDPTKIGYGNNRKSGKLTSNASDFTAKLSDVEELVRFWHINLGHMSKQKMITTV